MSDPRIVVIGGGLAGLSAAVACSDAALEMSPAGTISVM